MTTFNKINILNSSVSPYEVFINQNIHISPYEVFITPQRLDEPLAIKKKASSDIVTQFIDAALRNQLNINKELLHLASDTLLNNPPHPIDSRLTWRSKTTPHLTNDEKNRLMSLDHFCKYHKKQIFFGLDQCKQSFPNNTIWIDDALYSKIPAKKLDATWINPINPKKSLNDLINNIPENTSCIYLDWDYGDNFAYHGGDVAKQIKEKKFNTRIILTSSPPSMEELQYRIATPHVDGILVFDKNLDSILRFFKTMSSNMDRYDEETPSTNSTPVIETRKGSPAELFREHTTTAKLRMQDATILLDDDTKFTPKKPHTEKPSHQHNSVQRKLIMSEH